ncbi:MAG TPA: hypothetical protein VL242_32230 [Sorangium sp.]|nr:hypothetical protein [Sorangium sp.]
MAELDQVDGDGPEHAELSAGVQSPAPDVALDLRGRSELAGILLNTATAPPSDPPKASANAGVKGELGKQIPMLWGRRVPGGASAHVVAQRGFPSRSTNGHGRRTASHQARLGGCAALTLEKSRPGRHNVPSRLRDQGRADVRLDLRWSAPSSAATMCNPLRSARARLRTGTRLASRTRRGAIHALDHG